MNLSLGIAVIAALVASMGGTFLARSAARQLNWLDQPSRRKVHADPIPLLGGVAMYLAFLIAILVSGSRTVFEEGLVVLGGATLLLVVGVIDDRRGIAPLPKLLAQVAAALLLVVGGVGVSLLPYEWMNAMATIVWVVGICNAMNLLDNMDGLSAGVAAIACGFFTLLAIAHGQIWVSIVAAVLMGSILGFLRYNWNPATIFMGDAGSLLLGFMLAVLALKLRFFDVDPQRTWLVPIFILGVPIFDTTVVTLSRLRRSVPISAGGKDHVSHRLVRLGLSVRQAVSTIYLAALICGGMAVLVIALPSVEQVYVSVALFGIVALAALILLERVDLTETGQTARPLDRRRRTRLKRMGSNLLQRAG
jgi:UDP-GlcNAc:undecaprenyl-phosphate GlcNAc-1-phosphate transferase